MSPALRHSRSAELAGRRILVLNWRDTRHPDAGGAEQYVHRIASRWVAAGADVTWFTARPAGHAARDTIDGIRVVRAGGELSLYLHAAARLLRAGDDFDAVVDCQNGIPFFAPLFVRPTTPVVQVVHHVHQDQFEAHYPRTVAAVGRFLEGPLSRRVYRDRAVVAVSPSTREQIRRRLGFTGPIHIVPNGSTYVPTLSGPRDPDPTITIVTRLVAHKRVDLLLQHIRTVTDRIPRLRVNIVGDGPERQRLQGLVTDLGLHPTVTFHGYLSAESRDAMLSRAWVTTSTSAAEGWGCSIIEAAAWGVPCVALDVVGVRDAIVDGRTGRLVQPGEDFAGALTGVIRELADEAHATKTASACQDWARRFSWDRSAELLAGVLLAEEAVRSDIVERRYGRSDIAAVVSGTGPVPGGLRTRLRVTDEVVEGPEGWAVLLGGCDEFDAAAVARRLSVTDARIRLAEPDDLLSGPQLSRTVRNPMDAGS